MNLTAKREAMETPQQQQQPTITFGTMRLVAAITGGYRDIAWVVELVPQDPTPKEVEPHGDYA